MPENFCRQFQRLPGFSVPARARHFPDGKRFLWAGKGFFVRTMALLFRTEDVFPVGAGLPFPGSRKNGKEAKEKEAGRKDKEKGQKERKQEEANGRSERERRTGEANGRDELPERKEERQAGEEPEKGGRFAGVSVALPERFGREQGGGLCSGSLSGGEDLPVLPVADEAGLQLVCRSSAGQYPVSGGGREAECLYGGLVF